MSQLPFVGETRTQLDRIQSTLYKRGRGHWEQTGSKLGAAALAGDDSAGHAHVSLPAHLS